MGVGASFTRLSLIYDRLPLLPSQFPVVVTSQQTYNYYVGFYVYEQRDHYYADREDFTITDFNGRPLFMIGGHRAAFSLLDGLSVFGGVLLDLRGNPLLCCRPQTILGAPRGSYEILLGSGASGPVVATVKGTHTLDNDRFFDITVPGRGLQLKVMCEWFGPRFCKAWLFLGIPPPPPAYPTPPAQLIAKLDYAMRWTVQVAPNVDVTFVAAIVWCMDQFNEMFLERRT